MRGESGGETTFHAVKRRKEKKKKRFRVRNYIYKVFQTNHPTLVIKCVPQQLWHKVVGKANHVIETEERRNDTSKSASGGESSRRCQRDGFSYLIPETEL